MPLEPNPTRLSQESGHTSAPDRRRIGRRGLAAITASAVGVAGIVVGGSVLGRSSPGGAPDREPGISSSAEPTSETQHITGIENVTGKATPEQVQYVIENPVNIHDYPTLGPALQAIGDRLNVTLNSGEPLQSAESETRLQAMTGTYLDSTGTDYYVTMQNIRERSEANAALLSEPGTEIQVKFQDITPSDETLRLDMAYEASATVIYTTNHEDYGDYDTDYEYDFVLQVSSDGTVKVAGMTETAELGNIA